MIVCPRCGKDNQDHYKFCLGCGAELPRDHAGPKHFAAPAPSSPEAPPVGGSPSAPAPLREATALREQPLPFATTQQSDGEAQQAAVAAALAARKSAGQGSRSTSSAPPAPAPIGGGGGRKLSSVSNSSSAPPAPTASSVPPRSSDEAASSSPRHRASPALAVAEAAHPAQPAVVSMRDCPACGEPVPADFRFCGSCGQRMDGSAPGRSAPRRAEAAIEEEVAHNWGLLVLINPDGSEGTNFPLVGSPAPVGRKSGGPFAADSYLSPRHAVFDFEHGRCVVRDQDSLNGVYYKIARDTPIPLTDGSIFRIGQEILIFSDVPGPRLVGGVEPMGSPNPGYLGRISLVIGRDSFGNSFLIPPDGAHIGRERGDVIFPEDGYVSGLHCRINSEGGRTVLTDVGSSNGTFVRLRAEHECKNGELLLMGQQLFRLQF